MVDALGIRWNSQVSWLFEADTSTASGVESCESALRLLKDLVPTLKEPIVAAKQQPLGLCKET